MAEVVHCTRHRVRVQIDAVCEAVFDGQQPRSDPLAAAHVQHAFARTNQLRGELVVRQAVQQTLRTPVIPIGQMLPENDGFISHHLLHLQPAIGLFRLAHATTSFRL